MRASVGALASAMLALPAWGPPTPAAERRFALALSTWISEGRTQESHDASALNDLLGDPTSVLTYESVDSTVLELAGELDLTRRIFLAGRLGAGSIDGGSLVDDDYLSAFGAEQLGATVQGEHRFSRTRSSVVADDLDSIDLELGWRMPRGKAGHAAFELFVGHGRREEKYAAKGVRQVECTLPAGGDFGCAPVGSVGFEDEVVITNAVDWRAWWLGAQGSGKVGQRLRLVGRLAFAPRTEVRSDDTHHLRDDLEQDPSFRIAGDGDGLQLGTTIEYRLTRRFVLQAGWRRLELDADRGTLVVFPVDDSPVPTRLERIETVRDGFTLGVILRADG